MRRALWWAGGLLSLWVGLAGAVVLTWDRSVSPGVVGYRMSYGGASGVYDTVLDVGDVSQVSIGGLTPGQTYVFAATAYDGAGRESGYSNEVAYTVPLPGDTQPPVVTVLSPGDGSLVPRKGTVEVVVDASDNVGVTRVEVLVQGQVVCTQPQAPVRCPWRVPNAANKRYQLQGRAQDAA